MESSKLIAQPVIKKKEAFTFQWQKVFFAVSAVTLAASLAVWGYNYYYSNALSEEIQSLKSELVSLQAGIDTNLIRNLVAISNVLSNGKTLISEHIILSAIFDFLEKNTYPRTAYKNININAGNSRIDMDVSTENYYTFAQQAREFEANDAVEKLDFGGLSLDPATNNVSYRLTLNIKPKFFKVGDRE